MNTTTSMLAEETADAELVARSIAGDRDAFGQIVQRHQTLICSVVYNATGQIAQSEDLAQETFLTAWRELRNLREPAKLRAWLCGIARNTIHNRFRRLKREPVHGASGLEVAAELPAQEPLPSEQAVTREREAMLWSALERVPEIYREPLILFYRQHKSVERVAVDLGLNEGVVRQRLSRGRKLLQEQVERFVEGLLVQTTPGVMFTTTVLGSLPLFASAGMASAAGASGAMAKGGAATLGVKLLTVFNFVIGPLLGLAATWVGVRASFKAVRTLRERAYMVRYYKMLFSGVLVSTVASGVLAGMAKAGTHVSSAFVAGLVGSTVLYTLFVTVMAFRLQRDLRLIRAEERAFHPEAFAGDHTEPCGPFMEYRSKFVLLGLPLVHVRLGMPVGEKVKPAVGWIAVGDYAVGVLVAVGGISLGGVSVGGIAGGLIAIGGVGLGGLAVGGLTVGGLALGGVAVGWVAEGFTAYAWIAAQGWYAAAREFALGRHATAMHANDAVAQAWFAAYSWLDLRAAGGKGLLSLVWAPAVLLLVQYRRVWLPGRGPQGKREVESQTND